MMRGWAKDRDELAQSRQLSRSLLGQRIKLVRYVNIDYYGWDLGFRGQPARRLIASEAEWDNPTWRASDFHHVDYGVELVTQDERVWSITWDTPGCTESLVLRQGLCEENGAVWDVTDQCPWRDLLSLRVTDFLLRYHPWDEQGSFWCTRATLIFGDQVVEVLLGDADAATGDLVPSANNLAVLFDGKTLPDWERTDDLV